MRHKLRIEALEVQTFEPADGEDGTGTVHAHMAGEGEGSSYMGCGGVCTGAATNCFSDCYSQCMSRCWASESPCCLDAE